MAWYLPPRDDAETFARADADRHGTWPARLCGPSSASRAQRHAGGRRSAQTLGAMKNVTLLFLRLPKMRIPMLLAILALITAVPVRAQFGVAWQRSPRIVVIASSVTDARFALVDEAIAYWNYQLQVAGSAFRLAEPERVIRPPPDDALQQQGQLILRGLATVSNIPSALKDLPGDLRIVLGDAPFVSHAGPFDERQTRTVGIRPLTSLPLSLPNVARNVIAHELGHALGLPHNSDFSALMCGRPAECRPDAFQSSSPRIFPLLPDERSDLLRMYPSNWRPQGG